MLPPKTSALLDRLRLRAPDLTGFVLVGGTALTLRVGHRLSEDLDFFYAAGTKLPRRQVARLVQSLTDDGCSATKVMDPGLIDEFVEAGLEIDDFHQDYIVDGVKLSFFIPDEPNNLPFLRPGAASDLDGLMVASEEAIFESKALLIDCRTKIRDHFDLLWLCQHRGRSFDDILDVYRQYKPYVGADLIIQKLLIASYPASDEGLDGMTVEPVTAAGLADGFADLAKEHLVQVATNSLSDL